MRWSQAWLSTLQASLAASFRNTSGPVGSGLLHQQLDPRWVLITSTLIGLRSRRTHELSDTYTVSLLCPTGPLRSSLMNIISVYRKQAFITSSRLATRHTELHSSAHIHIRVHTVARCLAYFPAFCFFLSHWFRAPSPFISLPLAQPFFFYFSQWSPVSELLCMKICTTLRVFLHLSPIRVLLKRTHTHTHRHRHSPHGPANCVVQLTCKPAFL